ncbi:acetyltransferase [Massilia sp. GCM10023247]|uniref:acetyltransferase n=1 Tax=Massilia sp. GCM10023247 TaxID=3252643 RepID=UPI00360AA8AB
MKRVLIVGGGGFGLELYGYIQADISAGRLPGYLLGGVLDDSAHCELMRKTPGAQYLGPIRDYQPAGDEVVVIALGNATNRMKLANVMAERGLQPWTYTHPSAWVSPTATLGKGTIVGPSCVVNAGATVGDNVAINVFCSIGHGASVGAHSVLSPFSALSGDASLGERCFLGTRATLFPKVAMGSGCVVDAHSAVKQSVGDKKIVSVRGQYIVVDNRMDRS